MVSSPSDLWAQADAEHPGDDDARRARYIELMEAEGLIVKGEAGPKSLPCGWPLVRE